MFTKVDILKDKILSDINSGSLKPGDALPSRHKFMKKYGCARGSIDAAIDELRRGGYIYSAQGKGTFVAEKVIGKNINKLFIIDPILVDGQYTNSDVRYSKIFLDIGGEIPCNAFYSNEVEIRMSDLVQPGSGVVWSTPKADKMNSMVYLRNAGIPQILIGRTYSDFNYVTTDAQRSIDEGISWLLSQDADKHIAFVADENLPDYPYIAERKIAFYEACVKYGAQLTSDYLFNVNRSESVHMQLGKIADRLFKTDGAPKLICALSIGHVNTLLSLAMAFGKIPGKDFYLLCFDDQTGLSEYDGVARMQQNWDKMNELAAQWALSKDQRILNDYKVKIKTELKIN